MTDTDTEVAHLFINPVQLQHKHYEALRARFVEQKPYAQIAERLKAEDLNVGTTTIGLVLREAGFPRLPRRRATAKVLVAAEADVR